MELGHCYRYDCRELKCAGACGYSQPLNVILGNEGSKKYYKEREKIVNEYIEKASKIPHMVKDLLAPEIFAELRNFHSCEDAFKKLGELKSLIVCMEEI